ncbi:acyltransferase family protein [Sphingomonas sp. Leaf62]|uniref:acyltransferase family protein n=1 Tax=Sphingomonas sp. Leaf62 TaxID=1736228 RepID=UPI0009E77114|nr:acyltransferase [Sphingomonas sp. Leaf62]
MTAAPATAISHDRPSTAHYPALDGLRGIAALLVVAFHLFQAHARGDVQRQIVNHGYLAVDFFFLLSGFVLAHAYDHRWGSMSVADFWRRRVIRLQPMVAMGSVIGAALLLSGASSATEAISPPRVLGILLLGVAMIPLAPHAGLQGGAALYPLNGAAWSLFYEYIAYAAYAAGVRNASDRALGLLVALSALAVFHLAVFGPHGEMVGGWAFDGWGVHVGLTRVMFPFFAGILLRRSGCALTVRHGFPIAAALLAVALAMPRIGGTDGLWRNGLYEAGCVLLLFPLIVILGASSGGAAGRPGQAARFLGDLSYPLYITHYPVVTLYADWVDQRHPPIVATSLIGLAVFVACLAVALLCLRLYDVPVRRWLSRPSRARRAETGLTPPASTAASGR